MHARFLIVLLLTAVPVYGQFTGVPVHGQSLERAVQQFDDGNNLFQQGDFRDTVEAYRAAVDAGYVSGALYYNMGNAYFRLDEIGQAIRYYEKAGRLLPESSELDHNLALARQRTADSFSRLPEPFWRPVWDGLLEVLSPTALFLLGLLFYAAAAGALGMRIRGGTSPWLRRIMLLAGSLALCLVILAFSASYERARAARAVILSDEVTLLDRPDGSASGVRVHEGTVVDVVSTRAAWSEVRLPNGTRGWLQSTAYGTI